VCSNAGVGGEDKKDGAVVDSIVETAHVRDVAATVGFVLLKVGPRAVGFVLGDRKSGVWVVQGRRAVGIGFVLVFCSLNLRPGLLKVVTAARDVRDQNGLSSRSR
jgi:hypothetical protein